MERTEPAIGLLTLMFKLYDALPTLEPEMAEFAERLSAQIGEWARVEWPGVMKTRDDVTRTVGIFEQRDVDLIVVVFLTYAPSHVALRALTRAGLPVLVFNTQRLHGVSPDMDPEDLIRNHGMHGVQDLCNVLRRAGKKFVLVTGHYEDENALAEIKEWTRAAHVLRFLRRCRIGAIGHPLEQMGDVALDETLLMAQLGAEIKHLSQRELARLAREAPRVEIESQMSKDRTRFSLAQDVTEEEHEASSRIEWAVREMVRREKLDGFTANFMAVSEEALMQTLPFLASSKMLEEGYGYAGEGDVLTSVAVAVMQRLAGRADFTEMFTMDFAGNAVLMSHMGEGNPSMARDDQPVDMVGSKLGLVDLSLRPLLLRFALRPGPVTLVNITTAPSSKMKLICAEGEVEDFPTIAGVMTPHFKFKPGRYLPDFLTDLSKEGCSHHFALAYGWHSSVLAKIAELAGMEFSRV